MYAIVKTGGKQYRVEEGQTLLVERLPAEQGDTVALQPLLYSAEDAVFDSDGLSKVKVNARVVDHVRGPKLRVFKFKPKRGYRRTTGHRQELTRLEVTEIKLGARAARRPQAPKAEAAEPKAEPAQAQAATPPPKAEAEPEPKPKPAARRPRQPKAGAAETEPKPAAAKARAKAKPKPKAPAPGKPAARKPRPTKPDPQDKPDGS